MDEEFKKDVKEQFKTLNDKLDKYHEQTTKNTTDIAWLKRGMFGSVFSMIGAIFYTKFGGS